MASLGGLQDKFFERMKGRIKLSDKTLASKRGDYWYYSRTEEELQYSIDCRLPYGGGGPTDVADSTAQEEVILDRNQLAEGKKFCKALATTVSTNGKHFVCNSCSAADTCAAHALQLTPHALQLTPRALQLTPRALQLKLG